MIPYFLISSTYPLDKHFFLIPRISLKAIGFYPETPQTWFVRLWAFFNFFVLTYGSYVELYYGIYHLSFDVLEALDAICPVASSLMSLVKMITIWYYREEFAALIDHLRKLTESQESAEKKKVKRYYYTAATRLGYAVLFLGFWTATCYVIRILLINGIRAIRGDLILFQPPFKMMFPEPLMRMPFYPFTFLFSYWHGCVTVACFSAGDSIFLCVCFYVTTLLKCLAFDLRDTLQDLSATYELRDVQEQEVCQKLIKLIERYNEIADVVEKFSDVMVVLTLAQFVSSGMIIGMSIIDFMMFSGFGIVLYLVYFSCVFTEIFLYCLGGTAVMDNSEELATVAYCRPWCTHSLKVQKMILTFMTRTQRCLVVKVPFFAPSLPALTAILKFTGSLIALAKSII